MALIQVTAPTLEPVTVTELATHLNINTTLDNTWLEAAQKVARKQAENYTKRQIMTATWKRVIHDFPHSKAIINLPRGAPLSTVSSNVSITYVNSTVAGSSSTSVSSTVFHVDFESEMGRVYPLHGLEWPSDVLSETPHAVSIQYVSGWTTQADVPENIKLWIKMFVGTMYENRESISHMPSMSQEMPRTYFNGLLDEYVIIDFESIE